MFKLPILALFLGIFAGALLLAVFAPLAAYAYTNPNYPAIAQSGPPTLTFTINTNNIKLGETVTLSWYAQNVTYCTASGAWSGEYTPYGNFDARPTRTSNFGITCVGPNGSVADVKTVFVDQPVYTPPQPPIVTPIIPTPPPYTPPPYVPPPVGPLTAGCAADPSIAELGQIVSFTAAPNGGLGPYTYGWSGDLVGSGQVLKTSYNTLGLKRVTVTISDSQGRTAFSSCSVEIVPKKIVTTPPPAKPPVKVVEAPVCRTVTLCIDSTGKVYEKGANGSTVIPPPASETPVVTEATTTKSSFLASIFGSGATSERLGTLIKFYVILLIVAAILVAGYFVYKVAKGN